jgi:aromatic-L-amino-acid decarboxylase
MLWSTSPACTEVEQVMLDWLVRAAGLPERFLSDGAGGGVIQDSASSAALCALVAARERAGGNEMLDHLAAYVSTETHSSLEKGARVAGLRAGHLRVVPTDDEQRMDVDELARMVAEDVAAGLVPFFVCSTAGSASTSAFDPTEAICDVAESHDMWVHLDAAFAGSATVCPEYRWVIAGIDRVDSYCFNPHKWLLTNFDCSAFWVRDRSTLLDALSILPEYLRNEASASGAVVDYRDWQVPLGRRFRALKLWFVFRHYGIEGLRDHIRGHVACAEWLAERVQTHPALELAAPRTLSLVCLRHVDGDDRTRHMVEQVNRSGRAFVTHTVVDGRYVLRVAIGGTATTRSHVEELWDRLRILADD